MQREANNRIVHDDITRRRFLYQGASVVGGVGLLAANPTMVRGSAFTSNKNSALLFGVYEVVLKGDGGVANPFDTVATVKFVPPSGEVNAKTVHAFFDGDNTWRARVYVSEPGEWIWSSTSADDPSLDGNEGTFTAFDSELPGRLMVHPNNPRQWMTENDRWFLNLNDTAYFVLCAHDRSGNPVAFEDFTAYVHDAVRQGITSLRCFSACSADGFMSDSPQRWRAEIFADERLATFRLNHFQVADRRLRWLLDHYPEVAVQFILFPRGALWRTDEEFWINLAPENKERLLRYVVARYAAYPQLFWLVCNDAYHGPDFPNNAAFAREVGEYFMRNDLWRHPLSAGHARGVPFVFGDEPWATYIHLEDSFDLGASRYEDYHHHAKPVFLGEDRYEQDIAANDPVDMDYFQRRLFWAWLLSGGSANYGGRWSVVHPYHGLGQQPAPLSRDPDVIGGPLRGLDSTPHIRNFFAERGIDLSDFEPDQKLVRDEAETHATRFPKLMRRDRREFLIYHPNAADDGREARVDDTRTPSVTLDLRTAEGRFAVEWYRACDGAAQAGESVEGGKQQALISPWRGHDCVVWLIREA